MMKKHIPDGEEWQKIVDGAFSSKEVHVFSENYRMKKKSLLKGAVIMKKHNLLMNLTVTAAALAVVAFPTGIYLSTRTADTSPASQLPAESEEMEESTSLNINKAVYKEKTYGLEMGWLPDGIEFQNEDAGGFHYGYSAEEIKLSALFLASENTVEIDNITYHDNTVKTDTSFGSDRNVVINYNGSYDDTIADPENFGREIFVSFNNTDCKVHLFVTDDISKEDLDKIVNEMKLFESDTETAKAYTPATLKTADGDNTVNEGIYEFTESENKNAENYDDTIYSVEYGWLPEGLEYQDEDSPYGGKFHNWSTNDGMTPEFMKIPADVTLYEDTGNPAIKTTKNEFSLDGKTVSMYYRENYNPENPELNFGRITFIYFDNTPYVLKLYVTDGISEEDFRKIIDNVKLVPSEEETAGIYTPPTNEQENTEFAVGSYTNMGTPVDSVPVVQIGEEVHEKSPDAWGEVSAKVTGVRFDDDFNGLTTDGIGDPNDYSEYLNADGKLVENVRKWYNDHNKEETFEPETVPVSVMTVSITYTNNGTEPLVSDYCVCPTLQTKTDEYFFMPRIYNIMQMQTKEQSHNSYGYTDTFKYLETDDMHFSFSCPNQSSKNNIHLEAGESTEVTLAFIVEDKFRDNLYLSMNDNGLVDLSNLE